MSYETYALVRDFIAARALSPMAGTGVGREVVPYAVERWLGGDGNNQGAFSEHMRGLDFYLDPTLLDATTATRAREVLQSAIASLDVKGSK
jgi:hypothetical protein